MNDVRPKPPWISAARANARTTPTPTTASSRATAGRSCGVIGFGGTSPAPPRYLRPATKKTRAIAMPIAATAKPQWYPPTARAAPTRNGAASEPMLMPM